MEQQGVTRFIPLIVLLALIGGLVAFYGPGWLAAQRFRTTCNAMLADVRSGNLAALPSYTVSAQQPMLTALLQQVPAGYNHDLDTIKLTSMQRDGDVMWAVVTARGEKFFGQGKLKWHLRDGQWQWDPLGTYVSEGLGGDGQWTSLADYIQRYGGH